MAPQPSLTPLVRPEVAWQKLGRGEAAPSGAIHGAEMPLQ